MHDLIKLELESSTRRLDECIKLDNSNKWIAIEPKDRKFMVLLKMGL